MEKLCVSDYFFNVEYLELFATINPSKIKDHEEQKHSLKHLCNINLIGSLVKPGYWVPKSTLLSLTNYANYLPRLLSSSDNNHHLQRLTKETVYYCCKL